VKKGEQFCELADMSSTRADVTIDESEMGYVKVGHRIRLKMNAYPTRSFYGKVTLLGAQVNPQTTQPYYRIEALIENPDLLLKSGMVGKAKIETGYRSIGYVILRKPFRFIWKKIWSWLP